MRLKNCAPKTRVGARWFMGIHFFIGLKKELAAIRQTNANSKTSHNHFFIYFFLALCKLTADVVAIKRMLEATHPKPRWASLFKTKNKLFFRKPCVLLANGDQRPPLKRAYYTTLCTFESDRRDSIRRHVVSLHPTATGVIILKKWEASPKNFFVFVLCVLWSPNKCVLLCVIIFFL